MGRHFTLKQIPKLLSDWEVFQAKGYAHLPQVEMPLVTLSPEPQIVDSFDERRLRAYCTSTGIRASDVPPQVRRGQGWTMRYEGNGAYAFLQSYRAEKQAEIHFPSPHILRDFLAECPAESLPRSIELAFKRGIVHYDMHGQPASWHRLDLEKEQGKDRYFAEQFQAMKEEYFASQQTLVSLERVVEDLVKGNAHMVQTRVYLPCPPGPELLDHADRLGLSMDPEATPYLTPLLHTRDPDSLDLELASSRTPVRYTGSSNISCNNLSTFFNLLDRMVAIGQTPPHEIRAQFRRHPETGKTLKGKAGFGRPAMILGVPDQIEDGYVHSWVYKDDYLRDLSRRVS
ncbi:MAG TPA: hypothetical protein VJH22_00315 [Candidatus Nanoarchaeia archaeon]|nr:hypothetical protein [Candidatus Nanoarchaeia archaeon]